MNSKMKKRMGIVGGVIVIVVILLLAFLGGGNAAKVVTVSDIAKGALGDKKIQVSGIVVDNSYAVDSAGVLTFDIADADDTAQATKVHVSYDKGVGATFGNGVSAICTGRLGEDGTLVCTEMVTKCPSKYENASEALSVSKLLSYDKATMVGKTVKIVGTPSNFADATASVRFTIWDEGEQASAGSTPLNVKYSGALSDEVAKANAVVVTGSLTQDGSFLATEVAIKA